MRRVLPCAVLLACTVGPLPPRGQILLYVDTDAPVPPPYGRPRGPNDPTPLFDALVIDVSTPDGPCAFCSRTIGLDTEALGQRHVSFGIPCKPGVSGYKTRLRMYDTRATLTGVLPADVGMQPPPSVVDVTFDLPVVGEEGIVERTAILHVDDVGTSTTADTIPGVPKQSLVGTWDGAKRTPCVGSPRAEEVCIPGGSFWMGNPRVLDRHGHGDPYVRRLVRLSPYFIDRTEVTVAQYRASKLKNFVAWSGASTGDNQDDWCTFTPAPSANDSLPMNCVSPAGARQYCASVDGALPTEAQYEFVAGAFQSSLYVWGDDDPQCDDAVLGRGGWGVNQPLIAPCKPNLPPGGVLPVASKDSPRRDQASVGDDAVFDLVGNVAEFARDQWQRATEPCWSMGGVYIDPTCDQPSAIDKNVLVVRGGGWTLPAYDAFAASRAAATALTGKLFTLAGADNIIGFRCARAAN